MDSSRGALDRQDQQPGPKYNVDRDQYQYAARSVRHSYSTRYHLHQLHMPGLVLLDAMRANEHHVGHLGDDRSRSAHHHCYTSDHLTQSQRSTAQHHVDWERSSVHVMSRVAAENSTSALMECCAALTILARIVHHLHCGRAYSARNQHKLRNLPG